MTVAKHYVTSKPHNNEPSWFFVILLSGILSGLLLFTIGWYLSLPTAQKDQLVEKFLSAGDIFPGMAGLNRSKVLLVMGVDMPPKGSKDAYSSVRTDTMMLVKLDPAHKKINIISIPRDSKVYVANNHGINKINAAFPLGGADTAVRTVENTFGVDVDNYLVINIRGVREVVDALGGVDLYVEKPMHYRDRTAGLTVNLQPGLQHLDGQNAESYLRFRHDALGDIGRIRRQQQFISAVTKKLKDPSVLLKVKPLIDASSKYVLTDMATQDMVRLVLFCREMDKAGIEVATLPGHPSLNSAISYWVIDPEAAEAMLNRMVVGMRDNTGPAAEKPSVGILYTAHHAAEVKAYEDQLEQRGFDVRCKLQLRRSTTKLITHNNEFDKEIEEHLQRSSPMLKDAQLIFSPHGTTFETNACVQSDYTVILGDDTRSMETL